MDEDQFKSRQEEADLFRAQATMDNDKWAARMVKKHQQRKPAAVYDIGEEVLVRPELPGGRLKRSTKIGQARALKGTVLSRPVSLCKLKYV